MSDLTQAAATWDAMDIDRVREVAWLSLPQVAEEQRRRFAGGTLPTAAVGQLLGERFGRGPLNGAALVCGDMAGERTFFEDVPDVTFGEVDGYDISEVSLRRYEPDGLQFTPHVIDCNRLNLPPETYHLIVALHGAHHVFNLGNFFYQANKALKPGGLAYIYEWIGPEFLQIPRSNHEVASALLISLFKKRERTSHMGQLKGRWVQALPETFDPSEACNSTELYREFKRYFRTLHADEHGGLSYPIFEGIAQNLDSTRTSTRARVGVVLRIERILTRMRVIRPLFVSALGEKRPGIF